MFTDNLQDKPYLVKAEDSESEDDSESSSGEIESEDPTTELIKETKRQIAAKERHARKAQQAAAVTPVRRSVASLDEDMDLANLTSLSGGGRPTPGSRDMSKVECFRCKKYGHMSKDCPNGGRNPSGQTALRGTRARGRY